MHDGSNMASMVLSLVVEQPWAGDRMGRSQFSIVNNVNVFILAL